MTAVSDSDVSTSADAVVTQEPFPFWLATILITGDSLASMDGTLLNGVIILTPSQPVYVDGWAVLEGSASLLVSDGVAMPLRIPCTNAILGLSFTYTIEQRLATVDGVDPPLIEGVVIPSTMRPAVDISALL